MPEHILVHDTARVQPEQAIARAVALGIPIVTHDLAPWMMERGLDYGADGYLLVSLCLTHNHRREVLGLFSGSAIDQGAYKLLNDHQPDPPTQDELDREILLSLREKPTLSMGELGDGLKRALRLLVK